jgi:hypothetical protein
MKQMLVLLSIDEEALKAARQEAGESPEDFNLQKAAIAEIGWAERSGITVAEIIVPDYNETVGDSHVEKCATAQNSIAVTWGTVDIQDTSKKNHGVELSQAQAFEILQKIKRQHDAENGINWTTVAIYVDNFLNENGLYPDISVYDIEDVCAGDEVLTGDNYVEIVNTFNALKSESPDETNDALIKAALIKLGYPAW